MKKIIFKAFTLAEIMIVLTIIGVITAILLPVAINSSPDENVMKFKKGNNTLGTVIRELVNSDKYYANGSLSRMPNGDFVSSPTYFCETFADISNTKKINCTDEDEGIDYAHLHIVIVNGVNNTDDLKKNVDSYCKNYQKEEIILSDGVIFYEVSPYHHFGSEYKDSGARLFDNPGGWNDSVETDENGNTINTTVNSPFDLIYKVFCMDIDGINKGEDPFGYGIRADGKIFTGARADEWINKSMQKGD